MLAVLAVCIVPAETAHAQFRFWPHYEVLVEPIMPRSGINTGTGHRTPQSAKKEQAQARAKGPAPDRRLDRRSADLRL